MKRTMAAALGVALLASACSDPTPPPAPTPVVPTITETFTGTLAVQTSNVHQFTVQQIGLLKVTLTKVDPSAPLRIGVGTPSVTTGHCALFSNLEATAGSTPQLSGTATVTGSFCVSVFDVDRLVQPVSYTIVVLHS